MSRPKVFVYGTLMEECGNDHVMRAAGGRKLGVTKTMAANFTMFDLGWFPCVTIGGQDKIHGEVYEVANMAPLDRLEGCPHHYGRIQVKLESGHIAWIYIYQREPRSAKPLPPGNWRQRCEEVDD